MKSPTKKEMEEQITLGHFTPGMREFIKFMHKVFLEIYKVVPKNKHSAEGFKHLDLAIKAFVKSFAEDHRPESEGRNTDHENSMMGFFKRHLLSNKED